MYLHYGEQLRLGLHLPPRHSDKLARLAQSYFDDKGLWSGRGKYQDLVRDVEAVPEDVTIKRSVFTGFITDVGGKTSHTAIVARSLDIPAVVGAREASRLIRQDDWVVIDGVPTVMQTAA